MIISVVITKLDDTTSYLEVGIKDRYSIKLTITDKGYQESDLNDMQFITLDSYFTKSEFATDLRFQPINRKMTDIRLVMSYIILEDNIKYSLRWYSFENGKQQFK